MINFGYHKESDDNPPPPPNPNEKDVFNLGSTRDAVQSVGHVTDKISGKMAQHTVDTSSIIARARNSVLQFPMYVTQGIPVASAQIIGGYFERVYATLVQTVLSQNPIIDADDVNNMKFLKQYHANLREAAERIHNEHYEPIDDHDRMMKESVYHSIQISNDTWLEFRAIPCVDETLIAENARMMHDPLAGFEMLLEAPRPVETTTRTVKNQPDVPDRVIHDLELKRLLPDVQQVIKDKGLNIRMKDKNDLKNHINSGAKPIVKVDGRQVFSRTGRDGKEEFYIPTGKRGGQTTTDNVISHEPREGVRAPIMLRDPEIKKLNAMLPYTIEASFRVRLADGSHDRDVRFIIGVKNVMHLISPRDLAGEVRELVMGNMKGLQQVRYKTGEISRKEYLFNPKGLKADASKHINRDKRWINTLKRLAEYEKLKGTLLKGSVTAMAGGQVPIPNGTLVLSQPDITRIINETGIDLSEVGQAKRLAKSLFLIAVVIVDTTAETMRVLFVDSDVDWDVQSLASLDAELSKTDNSALRRELNKTVFG